MTAEKIRPFRVALMRPLIQVAVLRIEATSDEDATARALRHAPRIDGRDWAGSFEPTHYTYDVLEVLDLDDADGDRPEDELERAPPPTWDAIRYLLLKCDIDAGEGELVMQPWLAAVRGDPLLTLDIASDWRSQVQEIEDNAKTEYMAITRRERPDHRRDE